jgi:hypothetical protein
VVNTRWPFGSELTVILTTTQFGSPALISASLEARSPLMHSMNGIQVPPTISKASLLVLETLSSSLLVAAATAGVQSLSRISVLDSTSPNWPVPKASPQFSVARTQSGSSRISILVDLKSCLQTSALFSSQMLKRLHLLSLWARMVQPPLESKMQMTIS